MAYTKPQVTIDLEEYQELQRAKLELGIKLEWVIKQERGENILVLKDGDKMVEFGSLSGLAVRALKDKSVRFSIYRVEEHARPEF